MTWTSERVQGCVNPLAFAFLHCFLCNIPLLTADEMNTRNANTGQDEDHNGVRKKCLAHNSDGDKSNKESGQHWGVPFRQSLYDTMQWGRVGIETQFTAVRYDPKVPSSPVLSSNESTKEYT